MRRAAVSTLLPAMLLAAAPASGQIFGDAARTEFFGALGVRTGVSVTRRAHLQLDGQRLRGRDQPEVTVTTVPLALVYGLRPGLSAIVVAPLVDRRYEPDGNGPSGSVVDRGPGDMLIWVKHRFYKRDRGRSTRQLAVQIGVKLPTGADDLKDGEGRRLPRHLQLGSGAVDADVALTATEARGRLFLTGDLGYRLRGEAGGFEFGDQLRGDLGVKIRLLPRRYGRSRARDLFVSLEGNSRWTDRSRSRSATIRDSGGHVVFAAPGVQLFLQPNLLAEAGVQIPVIENLHGQQLGTDFVGHAGLRWILVP